MYEYFIVLRHSGSQESSSTSFTGVWATVVKAERDQLGYSPLYDYVYCFYCKMFAIVLKFRRVPKTGSMFGKGPLHHAHEVSSYHLNNYTTRKELEATLKPHITIHKDMQRQLHLEQQRWHQVLPCFVDSIWCMDKNNVAFRGSSGKVLTEHNRVSPTDSSGFLKICFK